MALWERSWEASRTPRRKRVSPSPLLPHLGLPVASDSQGSDARGSGGYIPCLAQCPEKGTIQGGHPASARHGLTVSLPLSLPLLFLFSGSLSDLVSLPLLLSRNHLCIPLHISHRSHQVGRFPTGRKLSIGAFSSSKRLLTPAIATQVPPPRVLLSTLGPRTPPLQFCRSQSLGPQQRLCPHDWPRRRELLPRNASRRSVAIHPTPQRENSAR